MCICVSVCLKIHGLQEWHIRLEPLWNSLHIPTQSHTHKTKGNDSVWSFIHNGFTFKPPLFWALCIVARLRTLSLQSFSISCLLFLDVFVVNCLVVVILIVVVVHIPLPFDQPNHSPISCFFILGYMTWGHYTYSYNKKFASGSNSGIRFTYMGKDRFLVTVRHMALMNQTLNHLSYTESTIAMDIKMKSLKIIFPSFISVDLFISICI